MSRTKKQTPAPDKSKIQPLNIDALPVGPITRMQFDAILERLKMTPETQVQVLVVAAYELGKHDASVQFPITDLEQLVRRNG